jgi:hypothetical protein
MDNQEKTQIPEEMDKREKRRRTYSMPELLTVSPSPHIKSPDTTATVMFDVLIALTPALIWGVWSFGLRALILVLISVGASIGFEAAVQFLRVEHGYIFLNVAVPLQSLLPLEDGGGGQVNGLGQLLSGQFGILLQRA